MDPLDTYHSGQKRRHRLFTDAADRLADTTEYVSQDVGVSAIQLDTGEVFYLKSISPTLWASTRAAAAGGLSTLQFSITHGGGDGDFKLSAVTFQQVFDLAAILAAGLPASGQGILQAVEVNCTEAFNNIGTAVGFTLNAESVSPAGGFLRYDAGAGGTIEMVSLNNVVKRGFLAGEGSTARRSFLGPDDTGAYDPNINFQDFDIGANLSTATTGKVVITLHFVPIPTAVA